MQREVISVTESCGSPPCGTDDPRLQCDRYIIRHCPAWAGNPHVVCDENGELVFYYREPRVHNERWQHFPIHDDETETTVRLVLHNIDPWHGELLTPDETVLCTWQRPMWDWQGDEECAVFDPQGAPIVKVYDNYTFLRGGGLELVLPDGAKAGVIRSVAWAVPATVVVDLTADAERRLDRRIALAMAVVLA